MFLTLFTSPLRILMALGKGSMKGRKCWWSEFFPFLTMFFKVSELNFHFFLKSNLSSVSAVKVCQSKILIYHLIIICINSLPNNKILDRSKLKAFADDKINVIEKLKFVLGSFNYKMNTSFRRYNRLLQV